MLKFKNMFLGKETLQAFWQGNTLSPLAWVCLASFVETGHRVHLYTYKKYPVPCGVKLKPAQLIMPESSIFFLHGSYATFADIFRYALLKKYGGWWVDTDVLCIGSRIPKCKFAFAEEEVGIYNNALLKFPRKHPIVTELAETSQRLGNAVGRGETELNFGELGVQLLTKMIKKYNLDPFSHPRESFYPLHWLEAYKFMFPEFRSEIEEKVQGRPFLHFWNYMFPHFGFKINETKPLPGSFFDREYLKRGIYQRYCLSEKDASEMRKDVNKYLSQWWVADYAIKVKIDIPNV